VKIAGDTPEIFAPLVVIEQQCRAAMSSTSGKEWFANWQLMVSGLGAFPDKYLIQNLTQQAERNKNMATRCRYTAAVAAAAAIIQSLHFHID
jgi:hypothetical protein